MRFHFYPITERGHGDAFKSNKFMSIDIVIPVGSFPIRDVVPIKFYILNMTML